MGRRDEGREILTATLKWGYIEREQKFSLAMQQAIYRPLKLAIALVLCMFFLCSREIGYYAPILT